MLLVPIGHEQDATRRLPWVTFAILGLCVVAFFATGFGGSQGPGDSEAALARAAEFWMAHPYLTLDPRIDEKMHGLGTRKSSREAFQEGLRTFTAKPEDPTLVAREQAELDRLCLEALNRAPSHPFERFGFLPAHMSLVGLFTHMFLHSGWLHLLGNLLILYLAGPFLEDVWGRPLYAALYLVSGIVAALSFAIPHRELAEPLVGASGAIAGVMGAFAVRYATTRVQFFYMIGLVARGTFWAPAWVMLGIWLAQQLVLAALTDGEAGGGVAYLAHIGGFAFGAAVALALKQAKVEERYLAERIASKTGTVVAANADVDAALESASQGRIDEAWTRLRARLKTHPTDVDAGLALWSIALQSGRAGEAAPVLGRVILEELRRAQTDIALEHWDELKQHVSRPPVDPVGLTKIAAALAEKSRRGDAAEALRRALLSAGSTPSAAVALKIAGAASEIDAQVARAAAKIALARPDLDPASRTHAQRLLAKAESVRISGSVT